MNFRSYIGDRAFYRSIFTIAVPIMIQNGVTNFVSLLDNIMVGQLATESMSGVSIVNQFVFVFNLLIFGAVSAAGIFTAQYHGARDTEGVRYTFRFKLLINTAATVVSVAVFIVFGDWLINLFLHDGSIEGDLALTLSEGQAYLRVSLFGLLPYALSQAYASTMRETEETVLPMLASACAVAVNFAFNLLLIFGLCGFPALGVTGAAVATVLSRFVELGILVIWSKRHQPDKSPWHAGAYASFSVPKTLSGQIVVRGLPLMFNEFFWSLAVTLRNQCYSTRGLDVVAAQNIASTLANLLNVVFLSVGSSIAIIVGKQLGEGCFDKARDTARKMMAFSIFSALAVVGLMCGCAFLFPLLYKTTAAVRTLSRHMIFIIALFTPFSAYSNASYFTLRSGGRVLITLLFDSVFMWVIVMPLVWALSYFTALPILLLFFFGQGTEVIKSVFGFLLLRGDSWVRRLVPANREKSGAEADSQTTV